MGNLDQHTVTLTFFDDKFATVAYRDALTLPDLADEIRRMSDSDKSKLPWLKMATFGDLRSQKNCLRTNANVLEVTGVEIDYDTGTMGFDAAVEALRRASVRALIYTSASYVKGAREKWRVLAPLSTARSPDRRVGLVAAVNGILGGVAAKESFVLSTAFYYGSVDDNPDHRVEVLDGDFIDLRSDLHAQRMFYEGPGQAPRPRAAPASPSASPGYDEAEIARLLELSQRRGPDGEGQWHNCMLAVTASLVSKGRSDDEIYSLTASYCRSGWGDPDIEAMLVSARDKYGMRDPDRVAAALAPQLKAVAAAAGVVLPIAEPDWRERYKKSLRPMPSFHNAWLAIEALKIHCSKDLFHHRQYIGRSEAAAPSEPLLPFFGQVDDDSIGSLRRWLSNTFGFDPLEKHVRDAVNIMCAENAFDPVLDMLDDAEANWDGEGRLDRMAVDYFNTADTPLNRQMVRKTLIAAVARARQPGIKFDTILTMESREGWNKSSAWRVLAGEGNFSDASVIGHAGREVQEQLADIWIHENAELAGMRKADIEVVKAFASRQEDRARPAYGHYLVAQPRRSIEVGTTNADVYLQSANGNRRFWPIEVLAPIDLRRLRAARLQLWGEAAHYQSQGEALTLDEALWPAAGVAQEARRVQHPWEATLAGLTGVATVGPLAGVGYIGNGIVHVVGDEWRVATTVIFEHVLRIPNGQLDMRHSKTLADVMRTLGWERTMFALDGKTTKGYKCTKITPSHR